ncbi:hypothetical protein [Marinobacter sp. P4B1]|uniref:hypothetical protein n=1 Tax=Marinobacter sp. P4B1 TaxID=1119533 RepID=UPI000AD0B76E|nr:hypothetical protein [Marinobacter sp. P4B1]
MKAGVIIGLGVVIGLAGVTAMFFGVLGLSLLYPQQDATLLEVLSDSAVASPVFYLTAVCFALYCLASWVFYREAKGGHPLNSRMARNYPWLPLLAVHTFLLSIIPAAIFASLLGVTISNLYEYAQGAGLVRVVEAEPLLDLTLEVSMIGVALYAIGCFLFWKGRAEPIVFFRVGSGGLGVTITPLGREWRIHYQPDGSEKSAKGENFFKRGLSEFSKEFQRWKGVWPEKIVMCSHLLADLKYEAVQREAFQQLADQIGYVLDYPDDREQATRWHKRLLKMRYSKLSDKDKKGELDHVRTVTILRDKPRTLSAGKDSAESPDSR